MEYYSKTGLVNLQPEVIEEISEKSNDNKEDQTI